jgi:hypothetical protein
VSAGALTFVLAVATGVLRLFLPMVGVHVPGYTL